ncbi:hypothetical protein HJA62_004212, partial [Vibrio vulnificus]|nr:hypothetical protein [Vibrio vulnificus]
TQTEIAKTALAPSFYITETYLYDELRKIAYEKVLKIHNDGAKLREYDETIRSYIEMEFSAKNERQTVYIPINGYYDSYFKSKKLTGELTVVRGENNNELFSDLYRTVMENDFRTKYGSVFLELKHFAQLSYTDQMGNSGNEYFVNGELASSQEVESKIENWAKTLVDSQVYRISEISVQDLENIILSYQ